ncbi:hypothetical protein D770_05450 [Flammeovirgaceae bacterium 311]|nr:hypothetical protein D770_05450 [Flammeovirgaceae bacterium 311]
MLYGLLLCSSLMFARTACAQVLSQDHKIELSLNDGLNIVLFGDMEGKNYYYLPSAKNLRLGKKEDGTPEFLFLKFTTEEREDQGGVQGAILHCLFEWSLSPAQLAELDEKVKEKTNGQGKLAGPVDLIPAEGESFRVISATLLDKTLSPTFITSGKAPASPSGKAVVASRLNQHGAQLLAATFEKSRSITDISLQLNYQYTTLVKAAKGKLTYRWSQLQTQGEKMAYDYIRKELDGQPEQFQRAMDEFNANKGKQQNACGIGSAMGGLFVAGQAVDRAIGNTSGSGSSGGTYEYHIGESRVHSIYDFLTENEVVKLEWEEQLSDERLDIMRQAFFDYFLNAFTEQRFPEPISNERLAVDVPENTLKNQAESSYSFIGCSKLTSNKTIDRTIILDNIYLPVKREFQLVSNLASTYDMVKSNPKCVSSINLNDPFFKHRDIHFIVDVDAKEMYEQEINYVTVNVRKKRSSGNDFQDAITINKQFLQSNGPMASLTYARGEDRNPDQYEYKAQWSTRGGKLYPDNPTWIKGDWEGVTLAPPVKARRIEFEADLNELKEMGITRATLQMRYFKYGEEVETNIPITVSKGQPLIEQLIFTDQSTRGYAYRMVFTHKDKGKLALPWDSKVNDDYVYASVPSELTNFESLLFNEAKEAGKEILDVTKERILDKYKEIIGGGSQ